MHFDRAHRRLHLNRAVDTLILFKYARVMYEHIRHPAATNTADINTRNDVPLTIKYYNNTTRYIITILYHPCSTRRLGDTV